MDQRLFKILLAEKSLRQWELARRLGWCISKMSQLVNSYRKFHPDEIEAICKELSVEAGKLFPEMISGKSKKSSANQIRRKYVRKERAEIAA